MTIKESSIEKLVRIEVGWAASETNEGQDMWDRAAERLGLGSWERARTDDSPLAEELHRRRDIWIAGGWAPTGSKLKDQLDRLTRLYRRTEPNAVDVEMERLTPELAEQWLSTNGWSRVEIRSNSVLASSKNLSIWEAAGDRTTVYHPVDFENLATVVHFAAGHARRNAWDILDEMTSGDAKPPTNSSPSTFLSTALNDVTEITGIDRDPQIFAGRYVEAGLASGSVSSHPDVRSGRLVLKGTRFLASQVLAELADNWPLADIAEEHDLDQEMLAEFLRALSSTLDQIPHKR